jgi:glutaconate CoA-transferase, subunit B
VHGCYDSHLAVCARLQYWRQGGRITVGFLGGAQVDRYGNLNAAVVWGIARE